MSLNRITSENVCLIRKIDIIPFINQDNCTSCFLTNKNGNGKSTVLLHTINSLYERASIIKIEICR